MVSALQVTTSTSFLMTLALEAISWTIEYGQIELGAVDQLDQRFPVQDRNYLHAKLDLEALRNDIDKSE